MTNDLAEVKTVGSFTLCFETTWFYLLEKGTSGVISYVFYLLEKGTSGTIECSQARLPRSFSLLLSRSAELLLFR